MNPPFQPPQPPPQQPPAPPPQQPPAQYPQPPYQPGSVTVQTGGGPASIIDAMTRAGTAVGSWNPQHIVNVMVCIMLLVISAKSVWETLAFRDLVYQMMRENTEGKAADLRHMEEARDKDRQLVSNQITTILRATEDSRVKDREANTALVGTVLSHCSEEASKTRKTIGEMSNAFTLLTQEVRRLTKKDPDEVGPGPDEFGYLGAKVTRGVLVVACGPEPYPAPMPRLRGQPAPPDPPIWPVKAGLRLNIP